MSEHIPAADDLLKQIHDFVYSHKGDYNIDYFKPSLEYITSQDTKLCFTAPEYAVIKKEGFQSTKEGFQQSNTKKKNWSSVIRDLFTVKEGFNTFTPFEFSPIINNPIYNPNNPINNPIPPPPSQPLNKGLSIVPPLKSNTDQQYYVACSSMLNDDNNTFGPYRAFDGSVDDYGGSQYSFWHTKERYNKTTGTYISGSTFNGIAGEWISIRFPNPTQVMYYDLFQRRDCCMGQRNPNTWYLFGKNDNYPVQIDYQQGQFFDPNNQSTPNTYKVANPGTYSTYIMVITKVGNDNIRGNRRSNNISLQIEQWKLYAPPPPPPPPPPSYTIPTAVQYKPPIEMKKLDNNLYSPANCMMNLAIKYNDMKIEQYFKKTKSAPYVQGLQLKIIPDKYVFDDGFAMFASYQFVDGYYNTFDHIISAMPPGQGSYYRQTYSCEWSGYIKVENRGSYQFTMSSDDCSLLWLGQPNEPAQLTYNLDNAFINIRGQHGMRTNTASRFLDANVYYFIRIQFGNNGGPGDLILNINDENNNNITNCFYSSVVALNDFNVYYSLVAPDDSPNPSLFYCYYFTSNDNGNNVHNLLTQKTSANYAYTNLWQYGYNTDSAEGNYVLLDIDGNLYLCNDSTGLKRNITNLKNTCSGASCNYTMSITNDGNLVINNNGSQIWSLRDDANNNSSYNTINDAIVNPTWISDVKQNRIKNTMNQGEKISPTNIVYMISSNGKYKVEMNPGNYTFVLKTTLTPYLTTSTGIKYTLESENSFYLYGINYDMKLGSYFYANNETKTMEYIPAVNNILGYSKNYIEYTGSYPDINITPVQTDSLDTCKTTCNADAECNYFYYYENNSSNKYCSYNKDPKKKPKIIDSVPEMKVVNPGLFIRTKELKIDDSYMIEGGELFPTNVLSDYNTLKEYKLQDVPFIDPKPIGLLSNLTFRGLQCQKQQKMVNVNTMKTDYCKPFISTSDIIQEPIEPVQPTPTEPTTTQPQSQINILSTDTIQKKKQEPMTNNYGYKTNIYACGPGTNTTETCPDGIKNHQITPLTHMFSDYQSNVNTMNDNHTMLQSNISKYNSTVSSMSPSQYSYEGEALPMVNPIIQNNDLNPPRTVIDGLEEDNNMIIQSNKNIQLLGMMTIGTLFITALFVGSR
jgi:hypothetical protein